MPGIGERRSSSSRTAKSWGGLSITRSSCPLQKALRDLREPRRTQCRRWKDDVFAWFAAHPEVRTVFVAGLSGGSGVVPSPGRSRFATSVRAISRRGRRSGPADRRAAGHASVPGRHGHVHHSGDAAPSSGGNAVRGLAGVCALARSDRHGGVSRRSAGARPHAVLLRLALLPGDRRRARRARRQPHDRHVLPRRSGRTRCGRSTGSRRRDGERERQRLGVGARREHLVRADRLVELDRRRNGDGGGSGVSAPFAPRAPDSGCASAPAGPTRWPGAVALASRR